MKKTWRNLDKKFPPIQQRFSLIGKKFGKLTVTAFHSKYRGALVWKCKCECGQEKVKLGKKLRSEKMPSCGCMTKQLIGAATRKHGLHRTNEYNKWANMKYRCLNRNGLSFYRYGGRGIKICRRWINSFANFFADMGKCPAGFTLERKNNDRGYEPNNCVWANSRTQSRNRNISVGVDLKGIAAKRGISYGHAWALHRAGRLVCK